MLEGQHYLISRNIYKKFLEGFFGNTRSSVNSLIRCASESPLEFVKSHRFHFRDSNSGSHGQATYQEFLFLQYPIKYCETHLGPEPLRYIIAEVLSKLNIPSPAQNLDQCKLLWGKKKSVLSVTLTNLTFPWTVNVGNKTLKCQQFP